MKKFLIIWFGQLISIIGSGMTAFALGVWIYQQTGQATPFALTVLFSSLPRILLSPFAGSLADRWNRRWMMILADTGSALTTLLILILLNKGELQIWEIYIVATLSSVFSAFQEPAYTASITMLVPKKDLARASGMVQMSQALEIIIAPLLAGILFSIIGLNGIIAIDFSTFFFAIGALFLIKIPQPKLEAGVKGGHKGIVWRDAVFGWNYLRARAGLFGILIFFALVNFLLNFAFVLYIPMILAFTTAEVLGIVQMVSGSGMLGGSMLISAWGGPKRKRINAVIGFIALGGLGLLLAGLRASAISIGLGLFLLMFTVPLASAPSQAIFQTKVATDVQGRVFAIRSMIARSAMPLAYLIAGPLADRIFNPLLEEGGGLANTFIGDIIGVGAGRGIGLIFVISGTILLLASMIAFADPHIRNVEAELPDVIPEKPDEEPVSQPSEA
jgi:MFS family permease